MFSGVIVTVTRSPSTDVAIVVSLPALIEPLSLSFWTGSSGSHASLPFFLTSGESASGWAKTGTACSVVVVPEGVAAVDAGCEAETEAEVVGAEEGSSLPLQAVAPNARDRDASVIHERRIKVCVGMLINYQGCREVKQSRYDSQLPNAAQALMCPAQTSEMKHSVVIRRAVF